MPAPAQPTTSAGLPQRQPGAAMTEWWREAVIVYAFNQVQLSACAPKSMQPDQVMWAVNRLHPTGIGSHWRPDPGTFHGGSPSPCPCDHLPEYRTHHLFAC